MYYKFIKMLDSSLYVQLHDKLNPKLWDDLSLKEEIKTKLLKCAEIFIDNLKSENINITVLDILFVGSNASYNYTKHSDIDLHIVVDSFRDDDLYLVYDMYRRIFKSRHDVKIKGYDVEIYIEPQNERSASKAIYSLNSGWVKLPTPIDINIDEENVTILFNKLEKEYKDLLVKCKSANPKSGINMINKFANKLYKLRKDGLQFSEFDDRNLAFKEFRNHDYIDDLYDLKYELETELMSL